MALITVRARPGQAARQTPDYTAKGLGPLVLVQNAGKQPGRPKAVPREHPKREHGNGRCADGCEGQWPPPCLCFGTRTGLLLHVLFSPLLCRRPPELAPRQVPGFLGPWVGPGLGPLGSSLPLSWVPGVGTLHTYWPAEFMNLPGHFWMLINCSNAIIYGFLSSCRICLCANTWPDSMPIKSSLCFQCSQCFKFLSPTRM